MSSQYPGGYNSPLGHRPQFNPQQQQQQQQQIMNQMGGVSMGPMSGGSSGGMGPMSGYGPIGMQSPSHVQQQQMMQQQQMQMQHQQHQMGGPQLGMMGAGGMPGVVSNLMQQQQQQQQQQHSQMGATSATQLHAAGTVPHHANAQQQQQQQQQQQPPQAGNNMLAISQPNPHKEINIVALSRLGQETVQDITSRFQEIFAALKIIQPTANRDNNTEKKVQEYFRTIRLLFKRVRIIYEKCNDGYPQGMEYTHVESLIPYKDETDHRIEPAQCEEYRKALQENQELIETVKLKNRQLREIIERTRIIIWEINTMLSMRRS